jgi:S1-C subfamily serine protease
MPDPSTSLGAGQDQNGFSRVCPHCGRRVPRSVVNCRCGADMPVGTSTAAARPAEPASNGHLAIVLVVCLLAVAGAAYWTFVRPSAAAGATEKITEAVDAEAPTSGSAERAVSPEARAWDAAANASDTVTPAPIPAAAPPPSPADPAPLSASIEEMVDRVMPAVVLIETSSGRGSGFFVNRDTLITNVHVVENDSYVTLRRMDGTPINARVESRAPAFDIAILKVPQSSPSQTAIPMGSAHSLKPGQEVIVIGSALGTLQNSVSRGIVSGLRTSGGATLVQTDAATNPGNSGGPMLDRNGSVIGITTMGYKGAEGLNFGVAIDHARDLLEGRQTNLGSARGLTEIQSQARGSESDRIQQQGDEQLRARLGQLTSAADRLDAGWQRFRRDCFQTRITGNYDREWFAVLVPRALPGDAAAGCASYYSAIESDIRQFKGLMRELLTDARQAGVLPGTIRDALRTSRLDFDWDR